MPVAKLITRLCLFAALLCAALVALAAGVGEKMPTLAHAPQIAFTAFEKRSIQRDIYLLDVNRQLVHNLTDDNASSNWSPAWSPDGLQLAFLSNRDESTDIYILDLNNFSLGRLFLNSGIRQQFSWSPSGRLIAFTLTDADGYHVHILDIQTGIDFVVVSDAQPLDTIISWSPNGEQIAFSRMAENGHVMISAASINSSEIYKITDDTAFDLRPSWSFDGNSIAFTSSRDGGFVDIYTINIDGSNLNRATDYVGRESNPIWSPDNQYLSFVSDPSGNYDPEIYLMNVNDGSLVRLTYNQLSESDLAWRPQP